MTSNVAADIAQNDLCIGCGICASLCPTKNLNMEFDKDGRYMVKDNLKCLDKCDACFRVCPLGIDKYSKNENKIAKRFLSMLELALRRKWKLA